MPETDPYAPKYTPFPPKGMVEHCFVKLRKSSYLYKYAEELGAWATGMLTAWCNDDDDHLTLTTLGGDRRILHVRRSDVERPYWP